MAKVTIPTIGSGFASTTALNSALDTIESELNNKVLYRNNPTGEPNQMENDLDMNGFNVLNAASLNGVDISTLSNLQSAVDAAEVSATNAATSALNAATSETNASASALSASSSAASAAAYSSLGLSTSGVYDFGYVSDATVYFPTDFGGVV